MRWNAVGVVLVLLLAGCAGGAQSSESSAVDLSGVNVAASDTTGVIRGLVLDVGIRPIAGATVALSGSTKTVTTLDNGAFGFDGLKPATYFVTVSKAGYQKGQTSVEVQAGVSDPAPLRIVLEANPSTKPFIEEYSYSGYLECGVAVFYTSVGCTTEQAVADATSSVSIWNVKFTNVLPNWTQGELVWDQSQQAGGELIWEAVWGGTNAHCGHRETAVSPALAYMNNSVLHAAATKWAACTDQTGDHVPDFLKNGVDYRFFGGPHPLCVPPDTNLPPPAPANPLHFGCGVTLEQKTQAIIHNFYNFQPPAGWRFTKDGRPPIPK
jgi:hypothetical protein